MIKDETGAEFFYWPIVNLVEGESSEIIIVTIDTPIDAYLRATQDERVKFWAKWMAFPSNPFTQINTGNGINMNGISGPTTQFAIYVEAVAPIEDVFTRVPLTLIAAITSPAGWTT